jgi:hypothetical protein
MPGQDAGFRLLKAPAVGLFTSVVLAAEGDVTVNM